MHTTARERASLQCEWLLLVRVIGDDHGSNQNHCTSRLARALEAALHFASAAHHPIVLESPLPHGQQACLSGSQYYWQRGSMPITQRSPYSTTA